MIQFNRLNKNDLISAILSTAFLVTTMPVMAQIPRPAVNSWKAYLPYRNVIDYVTPDNRHFYCVSRSSFFVFDAEENIAESYSKANGMNDVDMAFVNYDSKTDKVVLTYANGNIDLYANGVFENIPDIKTTTIVGDKVINSTYANNGRLYLSSGMGLIVANLEKKQIDETVQFFNGSAQVQVKSVSGDQNKVVVATNFGLYATNADNPQFTNYSTWTKITSLDFDLVNQKDDKIFVTQGNQIFIVVDDTIQLFKTTFLPVSNINFSNDNGFWVTSKDNGTQPPYAIKLSSTGTVLDSIPGFLSYKIQDDNDGFYWSCDDYNGLRKRSSTIPNADWINISAEGPISNKVQKTWAKDGELWLAHGGVAYNSWFVGLNQDAFSRYKNGWRNWKWDVLAAEPAGKSYSLTDAIDVVKDESSQNIYVGLMNSGLIKVDNEDKIQVFQEGYLEANIGGAFGAYRVTNLAMDKDDNLWITQSQVQKPLRVKTKDDKWYAYSVSGIDHLAAIAIDDYGQKWMSAGVNYNGGLVIYNDNGTLDNASDDVSVTIRSSEATKLPSNAVNTIAKDKNGTMWVGTENGMVSFNCSSDDIRSGKVCNATQKILTAKGFNFLSHLFENIAVKSIAIDGGNRKWIGTNVGLFLMDEDTEHILEFFTQDNSPLLSNEVKNVSIDPVTGVVFIATGNGLCSFGGSAIEATNEMASPLKVYPNPVKSGYNGMISIKGFTEGSNVKITDITGQMVYQATSNGGQLSWNGKDYTGRKVQSGVYLVYAVGKDGLQKRTGKFIIHE